MCSHDGVPQKNVCPSWHNDSHKTAEHYGKPETAPFWIRLTLWTNDCPREWRDWILWQPENGSFHECVHVMNCPSNCVPWHDDNPKTAPFLNRLKLTRWTAPENCALADIMTTLNGPLLEHVSRWLTAPENCLLWHYNKPKKKRLAYWICSRDGLLQRIVCSNIKTTLKRLPFSMCPGDGLP